MYQAQAIVLGYQNLCCSTATQTINISLVLTMERDSSAFEFGKNVIYSVVNSNEVELKLTNSCKTLVVVHSQMISWIQFNNNLIDDVIHFY